MDHSLLPKCLALLAATLTLGGSSPRSEAGSPPAVLYFFSSPEAEGGRDAARRAREFVRTHSNDVRLRCVLLVRDFRTLRRLTPESVLAQTLQELSRGLDPGSLAIPLYDEEGLRLAEAWGVRSVPSFVLLRDARAHRISGSSSSLDVLWDCSR